MILNKYVIVVLPAYNAERTLERILSEMPKEIVDEVLPADDASVEPERVLSESADPGLSE